MSKVMLDNGHETLGYTAGKMHHYRIKLFPGDRVRLEVSPYDLTRGRSFIAIARPTHVKAARRHHDW
jgi:translation initiation factor IF-1